MSTSVLRKDLCQICFNIKDPKSRFCPHCGGQSNASRHPVALREGTVLAGKYAVGKLLGKGGFGMTYLCYDLNNNKKVAIKEFMPDTLAYRQTGLAAVTVYGEDKSIQFNTYVQKFFEEAKTVSKFNGNPNIIAVHEFFYENNTAYFTMEYLEGMDLKNYIIQKGGRIPESVAVYITDRILDALAIVHSTGILHRDISPDNIFICDDGSVKLIDFGAARQVVGEASKSLSVILKPGFAPIEQYQKKGNQGAWTDIYALGATIYNAITGRTLEDAISRSEGDNPDFAGISPALARIINKMVALRIENRYQSVLEVKAEMNVAGFYMESPISHWKIPGDFTPDPPPPEPPVPEHKSKTKLAVILSVSAAVIIASVTALIIFLTSSGKDTAYSDTSSDIPSESTNTSQTNKPVVSQPDNQNGEQNETPVTPSDGNFDTENNIKWNLSFDGTLTISGKGKMSDYTYNHNENKWITPPPWMEKRDLIKKVVVEEGVTSIGKHAFLGITGLTEVSLPLNFEIIYDYAFSGCTSLETVNMESCMQIDSHAFEKCSSLQSIQFPANLYCIANHAFSYSGLTGSIDIPSSVVIMGENVFEGANFDNISIGHSKRPENWNINWNNGCYFKAIIWK